MLLYSFSTGDQTYFALPTSEHKFSYLYSDRKRFAGQSEDIEWFFRSLRSTHKVRVIDRRLGVIYYATLGLVPTRPPVRLHDIPASAAILVCVPPRT